MFAAWSVLSARTGSPRGERCGHQHQRREEPERPPHVELRESDPAGVAQLLVEQRRDQEAAQHEEDVDSEEAAAGGDLDSETKWTARTARIATARTPIERRSLSKSEGRHRSRNAGSRRAAGALDEGRILEAHRESCGRAAPGRRKRGAKPGVGVILRTELKRQPVSSWQHILHFVGPGPAG